MLEVEFNRDAAARDVLSETGRTSLAEALAWLAEGHPMPTETDWPSLLRAIVQVAGEGSVATAALRRVVAEATKSDLDTSRALFDASSVPQPAEFAAALDALIARSPDGTLRGITARSVLLAQVAHPMAIETLCLIAGVTYRDATTWFGPTAGAWNETQAESLLEYLNALMTGAVESPIPDTVPARAIEFLGYPGNGWDLADQMRTQKVDYSLLLAQRSVGSAWGAHKNKTSSRPNIATADALCARLVARQISFRRATTVGGDVRQADLQELAGIPDRRIGLVIVARDSPILAVAFSSAHDGGTARANGDGLLQIQRTALPFAMVLTGLGWSGRPETDRLARKFHGMLFTERTLDGLVDVIAARHP